MGKLVQDAGNSWSRRWLIIFSELEKSQTSSLFPASIILHTILRSITPSLSPSTTQPYHDPTLARMHPLTPSQTVQALAKITPEMRSLVLEANIKNQTAGPVATAWDAALRRATDALLASSKNDNVTSEPSERSTSPTKASTAAPKRAKNFWEKDAADADDIVTLVDDASILSNSNTASSNTSRPSSPHKLNSPTKAY